MISIEIHLGTKKGEKGKGAGILKRALRRLPRSFMAMVVMTAALIVGLSSVVMATDGKPLIVGQTNTANKLTTLDRNTAGPALKVLVEPGSAPLAVTSPTKVANLNADKLDGKDSTAFYAAGSKVADSAHADQADFATNANSAANADKVDGVDASGFYAAGSKVADSDKLDNLNSSAFMPSMKFASGNGPSPNGTVQFLAPTVRVTVASGQALYVSSERGLGASSVAAGNLNLHIGYRAVGSANPTTVGAGIYGQRLDTNQRAVMGLSAAFAPPAGTYDVGLVGWTSDGNLNWNNNEYGNTTAMVFTPSGTVGPAVAQQGAAGR